MQFRISACAVPGADEGHRNPGPSGGGEGRDPKVPGASGFDQLPAALRVRQSGR